MHVPTPLALPFEVDTRGTRRDDKKPHRASVVTPPPSTARGINSSSSSSSSDAASESGSDTGSGSGGSSSSSSSGESYDESESEDDDVCTGDCRYFEKPKTTGAACDATEAHIANAPPADASVAEQLEHIQKLLALPSPDVDRVLELLAARLKANPGSEELWLAYLLTSKRVCTAAELMARSRAAFEHLPSAFTICELRPCHVAFWGKLSPCWVATHRSSAQNSKTFLFCTTSIIILFFFASSRVVFGQNRKIMRVNAKARALLLATILTRMCAPYLRYAGSFYRSLPLHAATRLAVVGQWARADSPPKKGDRRSHQLLEMLVYAADTYVTGGNERRALQLLQDVLDIKPSDETAGEHTPDLMAQTAATPATTTVAAASGEVLNAESVLNRFTLDRTGKAGKNNPAHWCKDTRVQNAERVVSPHVQPDGTVPTQPDSSKETVVSPHVQPDGTVPTQPGSSKQAEGLSTAEHGSPSAAETCPRAGSNAEAQFTEPRQPTQPAQPTQVHVTGLVKDVDMEFLSEICRSFGEITGPACRDDAERDPGDARVWFIGGDDAQSFAETYNNETLLFGRIGVKVVPSTPRKEQANAQHIIPSIAVVESVSGSVHGVAGTLVIVGAPTPTDSALDRRAPSPSPTPSPQQRASNAQSRSRSRSPLRQPGSGGRGKRRRVSPLPRSPLGSNYNTPEPSAPHVGQQEDPHQQHTSVAAAGATLGCTEEEEIATASEAASWVADLVLRANATPLTRDHYCVLWVCLIHIHAFGCLPLGLYDATGVWPGAFLHRHRLTDISVHWEMDTARDEQRNGPVSQKLDTVAHLFKTAVDACGKYAGPLLVHWAAFLTANPAAHWDTAECVLDVVEVLETLVEDSSQPQILAEDCDIHIHAFGCLPPHPCVELAHARLRVMHIAGRVCHVDEQVRADVIENTLQLLPFQRHGYYAKFRNAGGSLHVEQARLYHRAALFELEFGTRAGAAEILIQCIESFYNTIAKVSEKNQQTCKQSAAGLLLPDSTASAAAFISTDTSTSAARVTSEVMDVAGGTTLTTCTGQASSSTVPRRILSTRAEHEPIHAGSIKQGTAKDPKRTFTVGPLGAPADHSSRYPHREKPWKKVKKVGEKVQACNRNVGMDLDHNITRHGDSGLGGPHGHTYRCEEAVRLYQRIMGITVAQYSWKAPDLVHSTTVARFKDSAYIRLCYCQLLELLPESEPWRVIDAYEWASNTTAEHEAHHLWLAYTSYLYQRRVTAPHNVSTQNVAALVERGLRSVTWQARLAAFDDAACGIVAGFAETQPTDFSFHNSVRGSCPMFARWVLEVLMCSSVQALTIPRAELWAIAHAYV